MFASRSDTKSQPPVDTPAPRTPVETEWRPGPADVAISAVLLAVTLAVSVPVALKYHDEAKFYDQERSRSIRASQQLNVTLKRVQARRRQLAQLRRVVDRYVADVEARPIVPWGTVVGELGRRRPNGVWTNRILGEGPRFTAYITSARPELGQAYVLELRQSPYVEFAMTSSGGAGEKIVGRFQGE